MGTIITIYISLGMVTSLMVLYALHSAYLWDKPTYREMTKKDSIPKLIGLCIGWPAIGRDHF